MKVKFQKEGKNVLVYVGDDVVALYMKKTAVNGVPEVLDLEIKDKVTEVKPPVAGTTSGS
jgi:hypothetical protein